jgi:OmpA-like transmembrane domain
MRCTTLVACLISALPGAAAVAASDFNPMDFYIGGAVGRSDLETVVDGYGFDSNFDKHADAWKVFAGLRPIRLAAVELGYMDLGHPHISYLAGFGGQYFSADVQQRAETLSGLIFAPIPCHFSTCMHEPVSHGSMTAVAKLYIVPIAFSPWALPSVRPSSTLLSSSCMEPVHRGGCRAWRFV